VKSVLQVFYAGNDRLLLGAKKSASSSRSSLKVIARFIPARLSIYVQQNVISGGVFCPSLAGISDGLFQSPVQ
jgi:hypothetical protein